jgi:hypothetical protein
LINKIILDGSTDVCNRNARHDKVNPAGDAAA